MARIRGSGNKDTELRMIALFRAYGITGGGVKAVALLGKAGFRFSPRGAGQCLWMAAFGMDARSRNMRRRPKTRAELWAAKLGRNRMTEIAGDALPAKAGWKVVRVWECDLSKVRWPRLASRLRRALA